MSGAWVGRFEGAGGRENVTVVEEIDERSAILVYAWGAGARPDQAAGWIRGRAVVADGGLTLALEHDTHIAYRPVSDDRLRGTWQSGGRTAMVLLARPADRAEPAPARPGSAATRTPGARRASALANDAWQAVLDGRYVEALPKAQEALAIRETLYGGQHPQVAATLAIVGEVYRGLGRFDDAERVHQRALAIREAALGKQHPDVAASLSYLAMLHNARATYVAAESLLLRALQILEQAKETPARNNRLQADVLENLAKVYRALGRTAEAEEAMTRAMVLWTAQ